MKISYSDIQRTAQQQSTHSVKEQQRLDLTRERARLQSQGQPAAGEMLVLSRQVEAALRQRDRVELTTQSTVRQNDQPNTTHAEHAIIESALESALTGVEAIALLQSSGVNQHKVSGDATLAMSQYVFVHNEQSSLSSLQGTITTEDGRHIDLVMHLGMEHAQSLSVNQSVTIEKRAFHDPLVLNFGAATTTLTDKQFVFDINGDGQQERIAQLGQGSGFLVFDRNQDGTINDGTEMFGLRSGNGFEDLAVYDTDANQWIDENDAIFHQLRVMTVNEDGSQELTDLKTVGVGAIYLGSNATQVSLTSQSGLTLGQIKRSGLFLMENGEAKTIQELDFANLNAPRSPASQAFFAQLSQEEVLAATPPDPEAAEPTGPATNASALAPLFEQFSSALDTSKALKNQMDEAMEASAQSFEIQLLEKMQWIRVRHREEHSSAAQAYRRLQQDNTGF